MLVKEINKKRIATLHPILQVKAEALIARAEKAGILIEITQALRTAQEQHALYLKGRGTPGPIVTWVDGYDGPHTWGTAFDIVIYVDKNKDGVMQALEMNYNDPRIKQVGEMGKMLGLKWGGDFTKHKDKPHFELVGFSPTALRKRYGTLEEFKKTWV